jgi:hypothetical protein
MRKTTAKASKFSLMVALSALYMRVPEPKMYQEPKGKTGRDLERLVKAEGKRKRKASKE